MLFLLREGLNYNQTIVFKHLLYCKLKKINLCLKLLYNTFNEIYEVIIRDFEAVYNVTTLRVE